MKTINQLNEELDLHKSISNKDDLEQIKKIKVHSFKHNFIIEPNYFLGTKLKI